ncbi:Purine-cytosine permease [Collimonas sp. OK607]|uniref:purine-cytosine permease family protein n=1 Tax=Collimonas sp. OK607 TaxID=1798194 RepID=UPI0008EA5713|nr:cytosine permease [Collimonas sp. OK607]SFB13907.1 Purine-cytosine permease [Collimonas sp. OK607]
MTANTQAIDAGAAARHNSIEAHSIDYIPDDERTSKVRDQGPFWFLGNFHFFTVSIGFIGPSMGLTAGWSALAGGLGILFGTLFMALHGSQGPQLGLPQMIQSRAQFGYRGVVLALLGTLLVFVGFNVVNGALLGSGLQSLFGWQSSVVAIVATVIAAVLAIYGHDLLHKVFKYSFMISVPVYAVLTLAALLGFANNSDATTTDIVSHGANTAAFGWVAFLTQFAAGASYNISYAPYVSDYSRYLPRKTRSSALITAIAGGASFSGIWMIALGAWLATRLGGTDALVALYQAGTNVLPGFGYLVVITSVISLVSVMGLNAYSGVLTVLTGVDSIRKIHPTRGTRITTTIAIAAIWLAFTLALSGEALHLLEGFLAIMLYFLVPWTAVNLVDYFFVRRGHYAITHFFTPDGIYGAWEWRGIGAYLIGFVAMIPFIIAGDFYEGPIAKALGGIDIGWLIGLIVSGGAYYLFARSLDLKAEQPFIAQSEKDLKLK